MKQSYFILLILGGISLGLNAQESYLQPSEGYKASDTLRRHTSFYAFDAGGGTLYGTDGDTILALDLETGLETTAFISPEGYDAYAGFLKLSPSEEELWAGYTVDGNSDDRIYRIDITTGQWELAATLPGNFDLVFLDDSILVTGIDTSAEGNPCSLFVLDTTGADNHRKIIETGGFSTGVAVDTAGNTYMGTSLFSENGLYKWTGDTVRSLLHHPDTVFLTLGDAGKLSDLPAGVWDCELDEAGDLLFTMNDFMAARVLGLWSGISGNGNNYDTLAVATGGMDWLNYIHAEGSVRSNDAGNLIYTLSSGRSPAVVHADYRPVLLQEIPNFSAWEGDENATLDLSGYFSDPDDPESPELELTVNTRATVASATLEEGQLTVDFGQPGQTNLAVTAISNGLSVVARFVAGVKPQITGDYEVIDFGDLELEDESYWNGSDGSGGFTSGPGYFFNNYNPEYFIWSGWGYSNTSDVTTPGFMNQYSAFTGGGIEPDQETAYAVCYTPGPSAMVFSDSSSREVKGFFITNTTYAALSMKQGDSFSKKFGGSDGTDEDWFRLTIEGFDKGLSTGTVDYLLADYTFADNEEDYLLETWQWVELSSLGSVDSLAFSLSSTDLGEWGMNTPAYFAMDQMHVAAVATALPEAGGTLSLKVYPNPAHGPVRIVTGTEDGVTAVLYDLHGRMVFQSDHLAGNPVIDLSGYSPGTYILEVRSGGDVAREILMIR